MNLTAKLGQYDTAELSDALDACGIEGALIGMMPVSTGKKFAGPAFTVRYLPYETPLSEFKTAGNYIDEVPENTVIVIDNQGRTDCTTWGDILTQVAIHKNILATVVYGAVRDIAFIRKTNYPLYANAITMRSGKNRVYKAKQQCTLTIQEVTIRPGDLIVGDDNGVIVIPIQHAHEVLEKAHNIKATEEAIIASVKSGLSLKDARQLHRYDQPWLNHEQKTL